MKTRRFLVLLVAALMLGMLAPANIAIAQAGGGSVYYLNFKPEQDAQWQDLAAKYKELKGVDVVILTAASGQYETTLRSEIAKTEAPTLFQVNGPVGLQSWKDYCYDLTGSQVAGELTSDEFLLKNGEEIAGIKAADVGAAMGITGTDVSKNAADIIITDDNFATIVDAVREGRTAYDNIRKTVHFLLSVNFAEILVMLIGVLLGWGAPITSVQLLFINVVSDGIPGFFISREKAEDRPYVCLVRAIVGCDQRHIIHPTWRGRKQRGCNV